MKHRRTSRSVGKRKASVGAFERRHQPRAARRPVMNNAIMVTMPQGGWIVLLPPNA